VRLALARQNDVAKDNRTNIKYLAHVKSTEKHNVLILLEIILYVCNIFSTKFISFSIRCQRCIWNDLGLQESPAVAGKPRDDVINFDVYSLALAIIVIRTLRAILHAPLLLRLKFVAFSLDS